MEEDSGVSLSGSTLYRDDDKLQPATEHTRLIGDVPASSPPPYTSTDGEVKIVDDEAKKSIITKAYPVRWFVLLVFFLHLTSNNIVWITTSPISDITACYYGISLWWINAISWTFMLTYVLFFLPIARFLELYGLRATAIVGGCINAIGCWMRFAGSGPEFFWLLLAGQTIASLTTVFEWSAPSLLSSIWFPPSERTSASALLGAIAPNLGVMVGLAVGPFYVQNPNTDYICNSTIAVPRSSPAFLDWQGDIGSKMYYYLLGQAVFASIIAVLGFFVPSAPPTPPSISKHIEDKEKKLPFFKSLRLLLKNIYFITFVVVFAFETAAAEAFLSVVDEVLNSSGYEDYQVEIGYLGIVAQVCAMSGIIVAGKWLDLTKTYYCTANTLTIGGTIALAGFAAVVQFKLSFWLVCVMAGVISALVPTFLALAYEYTVEMTYPLPEAMSASLLNGFSQPHSLIGYTLELAVFAHANITEQKDLRMRVFLQIFSTVVINVVVLFVTLDIGVYSNWFIAGLMLLAATLMIFVRPKLRRVKLDSNDSSENGSCWRRLPCTKRTELQKGSIQDY